MDFKVNSNAFKNGFIEDDYGKRSQDIMDGVPQLSFPVEWKDIPKGTKFIALVLQDYDDVQEDGYTWIHWLAANIPADMNNIKEDFSRKVKETNMNVVQGKNSWINLMDKDKEVCNRYGGPAPETATHEYELRLYALSDSLNLQEGFYYNELMREMRGKILAEATTYASYSV